MDMNNHNMSVVWVYNSAVQSRLRILLYMAMATIIFVSLSGIVTALACLLLIPLIPLVIKLSSIGVFSATGIKIFSFLKRPYFLPWDEIAHYGTVVKRNKFQTVTYVYFSTKAFITAPYEPMPKMCSSLVYCSYQLQLKSVLSRHWDGLKATKLINKGDSENNRKNRFLGGFGVPFYFVLLFRVLGDLTDDGIWMILMVLLGVYISIRVVWSIHKGK